MYLNRHGHPVDALSVYILVLHEVVLHILETWVEIIKESLIGRQHLLCVC
jgi:hypothetical protein